MLRNFLPANDFRLPACEARAEIGRVACARVWAAHTEIWVLAERVKVSSGHQFSAITQESLVVDLRSIRGPEYVTRVREVATQMTTATESLVGAADLLETTASLGA